MTQVAEAPIVSQADKGERQIVPARLPYPDLAFKSFGIDRGSWKALVEAIFPNAQSTESVVLALSYCRARKLDPFKRNVHIVPIWDKNRRCLVDTIWPGIGELRTTAFRTGEYAGRDDADFGPETTKKLGKLEVTFPTWCKVTVYRLVQGQRVAFVGPKVYWIETYATAGRDDDAPNDMWATRVFGQIEKCAEAAALRAAFPEEIGSDYINDEAPSVSTTRSKAIVGSSPSRPFGPPTIEQHPTDETRSLDTSTSNLPTQTEAEDFIKNAPRAPEQQGEQQREQGEEKREIDTGGIDTTPPTDLSGLTFDAFVARAEEIAKSAKVGPDVFDAAVTKLKLSNGGGKRRDMEARAALIESMEAGAFDWKTAKVVG